MNEKENLGRMDGVVIQKSKLLEILKENKERHDAVVEVATRGYWVSCQEEIEKKESEFNKSVAEMTSDFGHEISKFKQMLEKREKIGNRTISLRWNFLSNLDAEFPEDHTSDYERAIRKIELSVYEQISLTEQQFNEFVMNDWKWSESFLNNNSAYAAKALICGGYSNSLSDSVSTKGAANVFRRK